MGKILLAEDYKLACEQYKELLLQRGHEVEAVLDGKAALKKLKKGRYDLVVLDLIMPHLNAMDILELIKDCPMAEANGKVILLAPVGEENVTSQAKEAGLVKGVIVKTGLASEQVVDKIEEFLKEEGKL